MIAILEAKRAGLLTRGHLAKNVMAGIIVGIVSLPLAMAFAIASGARPEQGLYTAIVAGGLASLFGGSRMQITGPTGAFIVILAGITAQHGIAGLQLATLMAGVILLGMGFARMGGVIRYIPDPVIVGFTSGIGVIIFVGQWKDFFGVGIQPEANHFHEKLFALVGAMPGLHPGTTLLALATLAVLLISPRVVKVVPGPLVALVFATVTLEVFRFDGVATIGSAFGGIPQSLPSFQLPEFSAKDFLTLIGPAFTIALLGAIESLLSAVVADGMAGTKHDTNQELMGQGIANVFSPLFGGFAATGAIARTATNVRNGGTSPVAGIVNTGVLALVLLIGAPLAAHIPLCALSAILFVVAWNMSEVHRFVRMVRIAAKSDAAVLLITFFLTVFADLVIAVNIGVVLATLLFMKRMAGTVTIEKDATVAIVAEGVKLPPNTTVYSIDGPFFFGAAERLETTLDQIQSRAETLVLRLSRVPFIDATGMQALEEILDDCRQRNTRLVLTEVRPSVLRVLERAGVVERLGQGNILASLKDFVPISKGETP